MRNSELKLHPNISKFTKDSSFISLFEHRLNNDTKPFYKVSVVLNVVIETFIRKNKNQISKYNSKKYEKRNR